MGTEEVKNPKSNSGNQSRSGCNNDCTGGKQSVLVRAEWEIEGRGSHSMDNQQVKIECKSCSEVFTIFLEQMAEKNEHVTCPKCGKIHEYNRESGKTVS
jgi:predicted Zn finger-like uncharacterized protein